ncbi:MAG TPA: AarF/UbiB family protein [Rubrobacter sp.]|nr:AarF/UbiB family protein [Rubrobacter sp.]
MKPEHGTQELDRYREIASALSRIRSSWLLADPRLQVSPRSDPQRKRAPLARPTELRAVLERLGPTFIRLGQFLSTRPGLLPPEYTAELSRLEDSAAPVPYALIVAVIESELGDRLENIFASFGEVPLATGSIGQVHAARLLLGGEGAVVKVQRPLVATEIEHDLAVLQELAREAEDHTPLGSDLEGLVDEFAYSLRCELDYVREGQNLERLRADLEKEPGILLPRVNWDYTARRIIVLEQPRDPDEPVWPRWLRPPWRSEVAGGRGWRGALPVVSSTPMWPQYGLPRSGHLR